MHTFPTEEYTGNSGTNRGKGKSYEQKLSKQHFQTRIRFAEQPRDAHNIQWALLSDSKAGIRKIACHGICARSDI